MKTICHLVFVIAICCIGSGCTFSQRTQIAWLDLTYQPKTGGNLFNHDDSEKLLSQPIKTAPQVFLDSTLPGRSYHSIALMTVDGNGNEETKAIQAFINLSARLGADAVLVAKPAAGIHAEINSDVTAELTKTNNAGRASQENVAANGSTAGSIVLPNDRYLFRATAVIWEK